MKMPMLLSFIIFCLSSPLPQLIRVNSPDLVLFVGEALVGNEAVDQMVKFNRSLIDFADSGDQNPRSIDGIVLTKFDTIDDKVKKYNYFIILIAIINRLVQQLV